MANKTIPQLPLQTGVTDLDLFAIVDSGETTTSSITRSEFMSGATNTTFQNLRITDGSKISAEEVPPTNYRSLVIENAKYPTTSSQLNQVGIFGLNTTLGGVGDVCIGGGFVNMSNGGQQKTNINGGGNSLAGAKVVSLGGEAHTINGDQSSIIAGNNNQLYGTNSTIISSVGGNNVSADFSSSITNNQPAKTIDGNYNTAISNNGGSLTTSGVNCGMYNSKDSNITGTTEYAVMLGCSGRTATSNFTTYVETLEAFDGIVMTDYANLDFADDAAAATGGVPLGGLYHNSGAMRIRIT